MDLKISKKIELESKKRKGTGMSISGKSLLLLVRDSFKKKEEDRMNPGWNYVLLFFLFIGIIGLLVRDLVSLQVTMGDEMLNKSENNKIEIKAEPAYRGVILDRDGAVVAQNVSSMNVYIMIEDYLDSDGYISSELLQSTSDTLGGILRDNWEKGRNDDYEEYLSIAEKVYSVYNESPYFIEILIATDIDDDTAIAIKSNSSNLPGVYIDNGSKRYYSEKNILSQILGYTGEVTEEDLNSLDYVKSTDVIGRTGLEREYDEQLLGENGEIAWEVDALGKTISGESYIVKEPVAGENLYLTIDLDSQRELYSLMESGVHKYNANAGAAIIEDVTNGEILSLVSYPTYDNNLFVDGISQSDYNNLLNDPRNPLMNRAIAAQMPPGSTFKTIVASAALDAGAINRNTRYVSRSGYTFSSGAPFQEYQNKSYGTLNLIDAISVSSNIYFCELIRNWDMNSLVPYLEKFGIGKYTGIDIPGEAAGRLPSPANKIALANTTSPWLDPVWYPEGDSCNSVIGQGITLVTPLQMSNWVSAIANGGTLYTPHVAKYFENEENERTDVTFDTLGTNIVSSNALATVREGMWSAVNGSRATIRTLAGLKVSVAAKTGTAEFGSLNKDGEYEHTHSWVTSFFPYENPKYVVTIFLEDGGESLNAVKVAKEMIVWMTENGLI